MTSLIEFRWKQVSELPEGMEFTDIPVANPYCSLQWRQKYYDAWKGETEGEWQTVPIVGLEEEEND